jgi:predicted molibdopterin-dependent oxidoreductase YjgC
MFLNDNCKGFEEYKAELLHDNFDSLCQKASENKASIIEFAEAYNNEMNAVLIFSEKEISANTSAELYNLAMITGKLGKTSNGLISLKEKCNAHGIFDMGACQNIGVGGLPLSDAGLQQKLKEAWRVGELPDDTNNKIYTLLEEGIIKNFFIFGEDPVACANVPDAVLSWFDKADFIMVQDYFMTDTAKEADLILPASFPFETGGSFTNAQKTIQIFEKADNYEPKVDKNNIEQLTGIMNNFSPQTYTCAEDVMEEIISLLPETQNEQLYLKYTSGSGNYRFFKYGCDNIAKRFNDEFAANMHIKFLLHRQEV